MAVQPGEARLDTTSMISEDTFSREVTRAFGYLVRDFGYELVQSDDYTVRFERRPIFVTIGYDAVRSHEISIWVGHGNDAEPPFELADVLRATGCDQEYVDIVELMQTEDEVALARLLQRAGNLLRAHGTAFLRAAEKAFANARGLRSGRAAEYTTRIQNRCVLEAADTAWMDRDYGRVHELLNPIRASLGRTHRRRLDFVAKKL